MPDENQMNELLKSLPSVEITATSAFCHRGITYWGIYYNDKDVAIDSMCNIVGLVRDKWVFDVVIKMNGWTPVVPPT